MKRSQFNPGELVLVLARREDPTGVYPTYRVLEADGKESVLMEYEIEHAPEQPD